ncbi:MAG: hypothetical protein KME31_28350 [Tolypothrix carrinoi HA7290-LM1]|nr:hypothetical protein [Tolypothrix carrinoi HA7290-LM1]
MRKANKNQQDIFHLQLLQRKSRIFAVIDFNRGDRPLKSSVLKAYCAFVGTYSQSIGIKISFQYGNRRFDDNLLLQRRASLLPKKDACALLEASLREAPSCANALVQCTSDNSQLIKVEA